MSRTQKTIGNLKTGLLFVVSAPAGTGKSTLVDMLVKEFPSVVESVSYTTRQPRDKEVDGIHYNFITRAAFEDKIAAGDFLESALVYGDYYGTSRSWVAERRAQGKHVVLVIDTQGAMLVKAACAATFVFILPPSFEELRDRLHKRKTEPPEVIEKRLEWARHEIEMSKHYDYLIENRDLKATYDVLRSIFIAEEHRSVNK